MHLFFFVCECVFHYLFTTNSLDIRGPERHGRAVIFWAESGHETMVSGAKRIITRAVSYGVPGSVVPRPIVKGQVPNSHRTMRRGSPDSKLICLTEKARQRQSKRAGRHTSQE